MNIYELLEQMKKPRASFRESEEFSFFLKNRGLLDKVPKFSKLGDDENNEFNIMRSNIIIQALQNKKAIEKEIISLFEFEKENKIDHAKFILNIKERTIDLPYLNYKKAKIFIPIFSPNLNYVYTREMEKLFESPYDCLFKDYQESIIDPFDVYGPNLFDSYFTKLINIGTNNKTVCFFHYDTNTIYVVNDQGRLDNKIVLFDRFIKRPNYNHMLERLKPVVEAYFNDSRTHFIYELKNQEFISNKLYMIIKKEDQIR